MTEAAVSTKIAVIIVNYRTPALALSAARALIPERAGNPTLRVVIVDGGSGDNSADVLQAGVVDPALAGWVDVLALPINGGFGWANNQAIQRLLQSDDAPDYFHVLNPDTEVEPGAVSALRDVLDRHPRCGAVGSLLLNEDGSLSGSAFGAMSPLRELVRGARLDAMRRVLGIKPMLVTEPGEADWVTGASTMFRGAALKQAGLFDTGFFLYFEEVELMWRLAKAGWSIRHEPVSRVRHIGGASTGINYDRKVARTLPPLPRYWYEARRRMYARTRGRTGAILAGSYWVVGHALFLARRTVGLGGKHVPVANEARDLLRHGILPSAADLRPHVARWDDAIDQPPAWMAVD
ncbi:MULTISPECIES: glycosyltransferase family 2 protein [unclassified Sphingomonas]|uniref:glycosyltransferase n=1 Tax=unclassified Sphingomonas TaxID=196159 RepID=UPI001F56FDAF|nr:MULTISPECIES: glycosyltransferase family 2 protein [unclassified Sphingomonas]